MNLATTMRLDGIAPPRLEKAAQPPAIARAKARPKRSAKQIAIDDALAARLASVTNQRDRFRNRKSVDGADRSSPGRVESGLKA